MLPVYSRNLLLDNSATTFVFAIALNDLAGAYTIRATDVVTGVPPNDEITLK